MSQEKESVLRLLIVRQIEVEVVRKLKERTETHGVSMEEEHRRILREALLGMPVKRPTFKEALLAMPAVGADRDFERGAQADRPVEWSSPAPSA